MISPHIGLWLIDCVILPLFFLFLISRYKGIKVTFSLFLFLFIVSFLMFPLLIPRKHIELKLVQAVPSFWFILSVAQMHNNLYEEMGKLLALFITLKIFRNSFKFLFSNPRNSILLGFWGGLGYGVGEAVTLTLIAYKPILGKLTGLTLLWLFITWNWVLERALAIPMHGVLGGFVGLSLYFLIFKRWGKALLFFFISLLYHELIDGTVLFILYKSGVITKFLSKNLLTLVLPIYVFMGLTALFILFILKREESNQGG